MKQTACMCHAENVYQTQFYLAVSVHFIQTIAESTGHLCCVDAPYFTATGMHLALVEQFLMNLWFSFYIFFSTLHLFSIRLTSLKTARSQVVV